MTEKRNYIVLARKYRPTKLSQIIGQDETCKIIESSIKLERIAHAFLFSGTRGVGKTTLARILAKIVNCMNLSDKTFEPCGNCLNCNSIDKGSNIDVIEIDAASKTGVSDVREIIDNVNYKPVSAKKKIFIIDEVHMLSKAAFNALLKTLEEPPSDVIFIFATTETEKIPLTILSRCQRFQLRRVDSDEISSFLERVAKKEGFKIGKEECDLISQSSEGSVRDALSILDNVLTMGNPIDIVKVRTALGLSDNNLCINLVKSLFMGDVKVSFEIFDNLYKKGASIKILCQSLMDFTYHSMRIKSGVDNKDSIIDSKKFEAVKFISQTYEMDYMIRFWELLQKYVNEVDKCFDEKQCFEMMIMRLCYVSLIPTPFELLKEKESKKQLKEIQINETSSNLKPKSNEESFKNNDLTVQSVNNLAVDKVSKTKPVENLKINIDKNNSLSRFKNIVDRIEMSSEMQISYHLRNSFKLVSLTNNKNFKEIELESISDGQDSKKILWKASKLINEITKQRWIITLSSKKGIKSLKEFDDEIEKKKIDEIKKDSYVKKILEIIPSSEIVSVEQLEILKIKKKEPNE